MAPRKIRATNDSNLENPIGLEEKRNLIIADFKKQVKERVRSMKKDLQYCLEKLDNAYNLKDMAMKKALKNTKLHDFLASGGNVENAIEKLDENIEKIVDVNIAQSLAKGTPKARTAKKKGIPPAAGRNLRSCRKKNNPEEADIPEDVPDKKIEAKAVIPLKFLPSETPAGLIRQPMPGEMFWSVRGSPMMNKLVGERQQFVKNDNKPSNFDDSLIPKKRSKQI